MCKHVLPQTAGEIKRLVTQITFVQFFAAMITQVSLQKITLRKLLATHTTSVWFLSCVCLYLFAEMGVGRKHRCTGIYRFRLLLTTMCYSQTFVISICLPTHVRSVCRQTGMNTSMTINDTG